MNSNKNHKIEINDFPSTKIFVLLEPQMRKKLIEKAKHSLHTQSHDGLAFWVNKKSSKYGLDLGYKKDDVSKWIIGSYTDSRTKITHPKYMPLWVIKELADISGISLHKISKNIQSYRSGGSGNIIFNPRLPIKITPELESIIFHLFGDGYVGKSTPSFIQKDETTMKNFIVKLKNCFGDFEEKVYYRQIEKTRTVRFPMAISDILAYYYKIKSFKSAETKIPSRIHNTPNLNKLACIIAYISDEGNIRDIIRIASKNKNFLQELKNLAESCGYQCKDVTQLRDNTYSLSLSNKTIKKLYMDYLVLIKEYPSCNLACKHYSFVCLATRKKKRIKNLDKVLSNLLLDKNLTINEMSQELGISYSAIRPHINQLYEKGEITKLNNKKGFMWTNP